jgi:hypothetical protein
LRRMPPIDWSSMSGTEVGTWFIPGGRMVSGLVLGRPGFLRWRVNANTLVDVHGVCGVATPNDFVLQSLESCDCPIAKKSDANAADDFCKGIPNAELFALPWP